jgi:hypothetical protein
MAVENKIIGVESGGDRFAKNPRSSAYGPGQFLSSTWLNMVARYRPDLMQGRSQAEVLALRSDSDISSEMTKRYAEENGRALKAKGFEPNEGNTYLSHFAGPAGAVKLLSNPGSRAADVLGPAVVEANPFLKDWSSQQVIDWAGRKMGFQPMTVAGKAPSPDLAPPSASSPSTKGAGAPQEGEMLNLLAALGGSGNIMGALGKGLGMEGLTKAGGQSSIFGSLNSLFGEQGGGGAEQGGGNPAGNANMQLAQNAMNGGMGGEKEKEEGLPTYQRKPVDLANLMKIINQRQIGVGTKQPGPGLGV